MWFSLLDVLNPLLNDMPKAGWIFLLRMSNLPLAYRSFPPVKIGRYDAKSPKKEQANELFTFLTKGKPKKERD